MPKKLPVECFKWVENIVHFYKIDVQHPQKTTQLLQLFTLLI